MRRRLVPVIALVLAGSTVLAGCSTSSSSASGAPSVSVSVPALPTTAPSSGQPGSNPTSDFCTSLKVEQAKLKAMNSAFAGSVSSGDIATIKKNLSDYMAAVTQAVAEVETTMTSAPADVQAALRVFNAFLTQLPNKIEGATSLPSLAAVFSGMDTAQMKAAAKTLGDYGTSQCGG